MSDKKVPSPRWHALNQLYNEVKAHVDTVGDALKPADKQMAGGKGDVWLGPDARRWGGDLAGHSGALARQSHDFLADVHRELQAQDKEVTKDVADRESMMLSGRMQAY